MCIRDRCWGGYVKDAAGCPTKQLAYVDWAMQKQRFGGVRLIDHVGGIFIAGGGEITVEQAEIYDILAIDPRTKELLRPGDFVVVSQDLNGHVSSTGTVTLTEIERSRANNLFEQMDTTQDGEVTMTEFKEFAYPEATIQDIEHLFSQIDFDNNGSIGVDEFVHYIALHKQRFGDVAVGLMFRDIAFNISAAKKHTSNGLMIRKASAPDSELFLRHTLSSISVGSSPSRASSFGSAFGGSSGEEPETPTLERGFSRSNCATLQAFELMEQRQNRFHQVNDTSDPSRVRMERSTTGW
eukprot:TRINITY_DN3077_c0_g1_i7.p1 TRINITY_DN3077_c0_g1~~TRINITY_DN3077_c0_g1_i7.p1  ORF type:complete len:296 (-),score=68.73 TRINITY_DN3077_c0_g1_i7:97-984(-)